jgi:hypothetical protein
VDIDVNAFVIVVKLTLTRVFQLSEFARFLSDFRGLKNVNRLPVPTACLQVGRQTGRDAESAKITQREYYLCASFAPVCRHRQVLCAFAVIF